MALIAKAVIVGKKEEPVVERQSSGSSFNDVRAEVVSKTVIRPQEPKAKQTLFVTRDSSYLRDLMNDK
jgi:hypothetical protein